MCVYIHMHTTGLVKTKKEVPIHGKKSRIFGMKIYREPLLSFLFYELFTINEYFFNHERSHILKEIPGKTLNMVTVTMDVVGEMQSHPLLVRLPKDMELLESHWPAFLGSLKHSSFDPMTSLPGFHLETGRVLSQRLQQKGRL